MVFESERCLMDKEKLSVPGNMNLPFFAYGFF